MKAILIILALVCTSHVFAVEKFKQKLMQAKTNIEMKRASKDLLKAYQKEIDIMENKISGSFKGNSRDNFNKAKKDWNSFYLSESRFLGLEFSQGNKYGTSGSLRASSMKLGLLEKRYQYLKSLQKTRGL